MRQGLEQQRGPDLERSVRFALVEFANRVDRGHPIVSPPDFLPAARRSVQEIEVTLDPAVEATLTSEASRLGTTLDRLAGHAILASLAAYEALESTLITS